MSASIHKALDNRQWVIAAFDTFWQAYPRKVGKLASALIFFQRVALDKNPAEEVMAGLEKWKASWVRDGTERKYVPHPRTWLFQARWLDEPESGDHSAPTPRINLPPLAESAGWAQDYESARERARADRLQQGPSPIDTWKRPDPLGEDW